jgi:glycosyltransferase involved in cell wall biosynthesis
MRLLAVSTWCPYPAVNGSTQRAYHLLRALATRHHVDLVTFAAPTPPDDGAVAHLRTICRDVTVIPKSPFAPLRSSAASLFGATPHSIVQTDDPEVRALVRAHGAGVDVAIGLQLSAARYLDEVPRPRIFEEAEPRQIEGLASHAATLPQRLRLRLTWWKHARYLSRLAATMAAVTVVSEAERDSLVANGVDATTVHVVANGADGADLDRPRTVATPPRLIYPGAITYAPNLEAVVWCLNQVMPRVRAVRPDVELWVTGDTGDVPLDRIPNRDSVRFTGRLPDVKDAIGGSAATVVPLQVGGGTRLKVLESLSLGTPVVSTSKGVEGIDVADGVHVLVGDTAEAFSDAVLRLLDDRRLAQRLSAAGRVRVRETYTWDAIGRRLLEVVDGAIEGTGP